MSKYATNQRVSENGETRLSDERATDNRAFSARNEADTVFIYQGELDFISRCIQDYPSIETGGNLYGYWTVGGRPVVQYVLGPGLNANHQSTFFQQDNDYLERVHAPLHGKHALSHIGEWHSHHQLGLPRPSGHDSETMKSGMRTNHRSCLLLVIGSCEREARVTLANAFIYTAGEEDRRHVPWSILPGQSPYRLVFDRAHPNLVRTPRASDGRMGGLETTALQTPSCWIMREKGGHAELKAIIDHLRRDWEIGRIEETSNKCLVMKLKQASGAQLMVVFPESFPNARPHVFMTGANGAPYDISQGVEWLPSGAIHERFIAFFEAATLPRATCPLLGLSSVSLVVETTVTETILETVPPPCAPPAKKIRSISTTTTKEKKNEP